MAADGRRRHVAGDRAAAGRPRELDGGGRVWLERDGAPLPLDEIVLERFAIAAAVLLGETRARLSGLDDPALVELVVRRRPATPSGHGPCTCWVSRR